MNQRPVIETFGLTKRYGDVAALEGLDLCVPRHAIFGFLGPNGAGKTTTMKLLLGLAKPTVGAGCIFGLDIVADSLAIRDRIGYLPQQPRFYDHMTGRETLRFTADLYYRGPRRTIDERVSEMLALVGLHDKADRPVKALSGGERQRLGIAQAQINDPELLILDEPAAALDPLGRHDVLAIMERLRERTTIFYSTHILDDVQQVSDTVAVLNHGRLVTQGPIESMLNGSSRIVYDLTTRGAGEQTHARLLKHPWVQDVQRSGANGVVRWQVDVTDEDAAEQHLLRLVLADEAVRVTSFERKRIELEEAFIELIRGANDAS